MGVLRGDGSHAAVVGPRRLNRCCGRGWEVCDGGRPAIAEDIRRWEALVDGGAAVAVGIR